MLSLPPVSAINGGLSIAESWSIVAHGYWQTRTHDCMNLLTSLPSFPSLPPSLLFLLPSLLFPSFFLLLLYNFSLRQNYSLYIWQVQIPFKTSPIVNSSVLPPQDCRLENQSEQHCVDVFEVCYSTLYIDDEWHLPKSKSGACIYLIRICSYIRPRQSQDHTKTDDVTER